MHAIVHAANVQDRDGGVWLMAVLFARYPFLVKLYADGGSYHESVWGLSHSVQRGGRGIIR